MPEKWQKRQESSSESDEERQNTERWNTESAVDDEGVNDLSETLTSGQMEWSTGIGLEDQEPQYQAQIEPLQFEP